MHTQATQTETQVASANASSVLVFKRHGIVYVYGWTGATAGWDRFVSKHPGRSEESVMREYRDLGYDVF